MILSLWFVLPPILLLVPYSIHYSCGLISPVYAHDWSWRWTPQLHWCFHVRDPLDQNCRIDPHHVTSIISWTYTIQSKTISQLPSLTYTIHQYPRNLYYTPYYQWNQKASPVYCHDVPLTWLLNDAFNGFHLHILHREAEQIPGVSQHTIAPCAAAPDLGRRTGSPGIGGTCGAGDRTLHTGLSGKGGKGSGLKNGGDRETQNFGEGGSVEREWFQQEKAIQVWRTKDDRIRPIEKGNSIN